MKTRTFILTMNDGSVRRLTIPDTWKVTYGNMVPYDTKKNGFQGHVVALRIYERNKENLRACILNTVGFYEETIKIQIGSHGNKGNDCLVRSTDGVLWDVPQGPPIELHDTMTEAAVFPTVHVKKKSYVDVDF